MLGDIWMSVIISPPEQKLMTVEEFLALPKDGISRELIRGRVKERGLSYHNRFHSRVEARISRFLGNWLEERPEPWGEILSGEAAFRLRGTPESLVGIDVAFASPELIAATEDRQKIFDGPPILAVEILSPSDTHEDVIEKIRLYHEMGVVVWEVDPDLRVVHVHRPGREPEMFTRSQELTTEPELPGFHVPVARIFGG
jgi:Uma2 family endonuclease